MNARIPHPVTASAARIDAAALQSFVDDRWNDGQLIVANAIEERFHRVGELRHSRVANRCGRTFDGVGGSEHLLEQLETRPVLFQADELLLHALEQLVGLGQEDGELV